MAAAGAATAGTNAFGLDAELFTRGTGESRGESLVQKHLDKLQQDKENLAMEKLAALMPHMGTAVRVLALKEAVFDVETAIAVLRSFQTQNDEALKALHKRRKKLSESEVEAVKEAEERAAAISSSSDSEQESGSSSSDDSDSDGGKGRKKRSSSGKDGKKKRKRSSKDSKRSSKSKKKKRRGADDSDSDSDSDGGRRRRDKDRKKKKDKKDSSKPAAAKTLRTNTDNFGRFGIIRETDMSTKRGEFLLWAVEVKKADPESLGRQEEKELFKDFMEDYNTGTMPHRKYYNLDIYQREKALKEAAKQGKKPARTKPSALEDEEMLRREREAERQKVAAERLQQAYAELQATDKARDMREQEMLRLQMQAAYKAGDKKTAEQIFKRLMPEEERKAKGIK